MLSVSKWLNRFRFVYTVLSLLHLLFGRASPHPLKSVSLRINSTSVYKILIHFIELQQQMSDIKTVYTLFQNKFQFMRFLSRSVNIIHVEFQLCTERLVVPTQVELKCRTFQSLKQQEKCNGHLIFPHSSYLTSRLVLLLVQDYEGNDWEL